MSLKLQESGIRANTMTRTRFLALERKSAERIVADRTLNNVVVTRKTLEFCASKKWNYRISSGMMPLQTLPYANLSMANNYNFDIIKREFKLCADVIKNTICGAALTQINLLCLLVQIQMFLKNQWKN